MKTYTNREIFNSDEGIIYINPDNSFRISEIQTKPNGSNSNYLSIGKFKKAQDDLGDIISKWIHYEYPNKFKMEGYKIKREYVGSGAAQRINWSFLIPKTFISQGFGIAIIGSGVGGRGYRSTNIDVFFDKDRLDRGTGIIKS